MRAMVEKRIEDLGLNVLSVLNGLGNFTNYTMKTIFWTFKPPYRWKLLIDQVVFIGNKSVFIIFLTSSFTGAVLRSRFMWG